MQPTTPLMRSLRDAPTLHARTILDRHARALFAPLGDGTFEKRFESVRGFPSCLPGPLLIVGRSTKGVAKAYGIVLVGRCLTAADLLEELPGRAVPEQLGDGLRRWPRALDIDDSPDCRIAFDPPVPMLPWDTAHPGIRNGLTWEVSGAKADQIRALVLQQPIE